MRQGARDSARGLLEDGSKERFCKKCGAGVRPDRSRQGGPCDRRRSDKESGAQSGRQEITKQGWKLSGGACPAGLISEAHSTVTRWQKHKRPAAPAPTPRLQERYQKEIVPELLEEARPHESASRCRGSKRSWSAWALASAIDRQEVHGRGGRRAGGDHRPEAGPLQGAQERSPPSALREGMDVGCKVTLRGRRMYEFLDRLISLALPRVRDFRGLNPNAFDGHGNYSLGLTEQLVFPELNPDKYTRVQGMNITYVSRRSIERRSRASCCERLGMPFQTLKVVGGA